MGQQKSIGSTGLAMPKINIKGVKLYNSRGRLYAYHRATGIRLKNPIGTSEFFAELKRAHDKVSAAVIYSGTWGALKRDYLSSPKYLSELSPRTRSDYKKVLDWIGLDDMPLQDWDRGFAVSLRDKAHLRERADQKLEHQSRLAAEIMTVLKFTQVRLQVAL